MQVLRAKACKERHQDYVTFLRRQIDLKEAAKEADLNHELEVNPKASPLFSEFVLNLVHRNAWRNT